MPETDKAQFGYGLGVDRYGNAVIDPSENVKALSEAANKRQDDLREANDRLSAEKIARVAEVQALHAQYQQRLGDMRAQHNAALVDLHSRHDEQIHKAEQDRLNSIRQIDVSAVSTEAARNLSAIQTLAAQTATNAETLRAALVTTASTIAASTAETVAGLSTRIAALEKSSYEGKGKGEGIGATWGILIGVLTLIIAVAAVVVAFAWNGRSPAPNVIYTPSSQGNLLPSAPPQPAPR